MPTSQAATEIAKEALQAPINNLVIIVAILALVIIICSIFVLWKVTPIVIKQVQQLIDNNSQLTKIAAQNSDQTRIIQDSITKQTSAIVETKNSIEAQTIEIKTQSLDLRNYQTLVSDNLSAHTSQIEANTATLARFEATMAALPEQIRAMIADNLKCAGIEQSIQILRQEVKQAIFQQQRATGTFPAVPIAPATDNGDKK